MHFCGVNSKQMHMRAPDRISEIAAQTCRQGPDIIDQSETCIFQDFRKDQKFGKMQVSDFCFCPNYFKSSEKFIWIP